LAPLKFRIPVILGAGAIAAVLLLAIAEPEQLRPTADVGRFP